MAVLATGSASRASVTPVNRNWAASAARRFAWVYCAATLALTLMIPLILDGSVRYPRRYIVGAAFVISMIAWPLICKWPAREGPAYLRGAAIVFMLVGAAGLYHLAIPPLPDGLANAMFNSPWSRTEAGIYLGLGGVGLVASFVYARLAASSGRLGTFAGD